MADRAFEDLPEEVEEAPPPRRSRWWSRIAKMLVALLLLAAVAAAGLIAFLDTDAGHRWIADRIAAQTPESGLDIRIGRIEGSIWGKTRLRDVRLYDPQGLFAESPRIDLEWQPLGWVANRLLIDELRSDLVVLHRLPRLRPSREPQPILPDFDIRVGRLQVAQLRFEKGVTGQRRIARLAGAADVRSGRALIDIDAAVKGGDRLAMLIDAEPDRDHFDIDVRLDAPAGGVAGAILGTRRPIQLEIKGDGRWSAWAGTARLQLSGRRAAELALRAQHGRYSLTGGLMPAQFLKGKQQRLTAPRVLLNARGALADRRLDGTVSLRSAALKVEAKGAVDLARSAFGDVRIAADLLQPAALFPNMTGRNIRLAALLDGPFRTAAFAYRVTSPRIAFDDTGFEEAKAEGSGRLSREPVTVPLRFTARRVTGVGDVAGGILANLKVDGLLKVTRTRLTGEGLALTSDKLNGKLSLFVDLRDGGAYHVIVSGGLARYLIPGLGIVDVTSELKVVEGPGGKGTLVTGKGRAWVRRFDNRFLAGLAGGLPQIEADLVRGPDKILHFRNLRLAAPSIRIAGAGHRRRDGTFWFEGSGRQAEYGEFTLTLDGRIDRPRLAIRLQRPNEALGLSNLLLRLDPNAAGFAYAAEGQSTLGPFTSRGAILLPKGQPTIIQVAALNVSGTGASGMLRSDPGGFTGRLDVAGGGLDGRLLFSPVGGVQRIEAHLAATNARFAGPPPITIRSGKLDGVILLNPGAASVEGKLSARGVSRGALSVASVEAEASMRGGSGRIRADISGRRGRDFAFRTVADVAPGRISLTGEGNVDRRAIRLREPALLTKVGEDWRLDATELTFAGGSATVSGLFGPARTDLDARLQAMPLTVLDIGWPRLGLGGVASGAVSYRAPTGGAPPSGAANLRVRGLTRAGLVLSSRPVDIGLVAKLAGGAAAMRAVAVSEGKTIGRAQARIAQLGGGGLADQLARAPLFAQLRYNGPADTLWRLTGLELLDLSGPIAVGADARGTLNDPQIRGSVRTERARLESAVTGTVIENIRAAGRFGGSRLVLDSFTGATKGNGQVTGRGAFDFSASRGFGIDLALRTQAAQLIDRDDIKAQVTGPLTVKSDGSGGLISGRLELVSGSFKLGSATAAAQVPRLRVRELNRPDDAPEPVRTDPWRLDLAVAGDNRIGVTGLGMTSEWGADLRLAGTVTQPRITGRAELVRGNYDFAGRRFRLERGVIRFLGETPINPSLDIVAEGGIQGLNATIRVTGRGQKPEIAFASTPALPQDELLSRLLFGTSITNLSAPEALQLAAAVASLNNTAEGLDPINSVRSAIGLDRLRVLPADISTGQGTSIAAGKYIGRRVYVEVVTDGRGYSATQIEYQITRWLSLLSSISTVGRESVNVRVSKDY